MKNFAMDSELFYEQLPLHDQFADISNPEVYTPLPDDWYVAVSDVKNSTDAIRRGGYKEVNLVGASTIIAILNIKKSFVLPFVFGGDGACICIPKSILEPTRQALLATQKMAREIFHIELRVGIIPVSFIRSNGHEVLVTRYTLSPTCSQAAFSGGGLQFAEECLKDSRTTSQFNIEQEQTEAVADFSGLECRWQNVPSVHGEIITLIVQALAVTASEKNAIYREVIAAVKKIYGEDARCHPLQKNKLTMSLREKQLAGESNIRSYAKGILYRMKYWLHIRWNVVLGMWLMKVNYASKKIKWETYKDRLIEHTDFKKFSDQLRYVLSGSEQQREQLYSYLEEKFIASELVFGIHVASSAMVTCLIFNYDDAHFHFVDADDGGYTMAAKQLKERLQQIKNM